MTHKNFSHLLQVSVSSLALLAAFIASPAPSLAYEYTTTGTPNSQNYFTSTQILSQNYMVNQIVQQHYSNVLLSMDQPLVRSNQTQSGAMFSNVMGGYTSGQYNLYNLTFLGGLSFGPQKYTDVRFDAAPTLALGARYLFDTSAPAWHPFIEVGGWLTPDQTMRLTRLYKVRENEYGKGEGNTDTFQGAWFTRAGLAWDFTDKDQLSGWGEFGQQYLSFSGYIEEGIAINPAPATIAGGTSSMNVAREGFSLSHRFTEVIAVTLTGNAAHAFDVHPNLVFSDAAYDPVSPPGKSYTWGEFSARLETRLTGPLFMNISTGGSVGGEGVGTHYTTGAGLGLHF